MIKFGILGSRGRLGKLITQLISSEFSSHAQLVAQVNRGEALDPLFETDVIIDVSSPLAMSTLAKLALEKKQTLPVFVIGSTGWTPEERNLLEQLGKKTGVLVTSNFSVGIFILSEILRTFSPLLQKLGYTPILTEVHHIHKKDAPSGTALSLQKVINSKNPTQIQTHSIRAGEVVGNHEITFYGPGDHLSLKHSAQDRTIFARGAIQMALWLFDQQKKKLNPLQGCLGVENYFESLKE